jgi:IclR family acetate operon transcriptional repressor
MTSPAAPAAFDPDEARSKNDGMTARVVAVLDHLARTPATGVGVRQLATELGLSRSAVHRVLQTLAELHVARALSSGSYAPGSVMASWAALLAGQHSLLSASADVLDRLVASVGETAYLFSYESPNHYATVLAGSQCGKPVRYMLELGSTAPLHVGAAGKAILAYLPEEMLSELPLARNAREKAAARTALLEDLAITRERGFAVSVGERIPEACGIASAFFVDDAPAGSIDITIPRYRMDLDQVETYGRLVFAAAHELSRLLGSVGSPPAAMAAE